MTFPSRAAPPLYVRPVISSSDLCRIEGVRPSSQHYDRVIRSDCDVIDSTSGRHVLAFRRGVLSRTSVELARRVFGDIDELLRPSFARQSAAGLPDLARFRAVRPDIIELVPVKGRQFAVRARRRDGLLLKDPLCNPVYSFMAGYNYDRYRKRGIPTGFSKSFPGKWQEALPFFDEVGRMLQRYAPEAASRMAEWCDLHEVRPHFTIGATVLSTVAINVNYDSCFHYDRADYTEGCSTLTAVGVGGGYSGGYIVFPEYALAVDVREGDLLLNQSHKDLHGNTSVEPKDAGGKRVSFVTYLKKTLKHATNK